MNRKGLLVILMGPSGSGKGTVLKELLKSEDNTFLSVSATTRKPRQGEVDGESYFFLTRESFEELLQNDGLLEHATYCENYYGTPRKAVEERIARGENVILEIEMQGAMQVRETAESCVCIFIMPPSLEELKKRLFGRNTEDEETINKRIAAAEAEIEYARTADYIVVNDDLSQAVAEVSAILKAERCKIENMGEIISTVLNG